MSLIKPLGNLFSPKSPQKGFAVKESWNVNGQQFDSSQDLLDSGRDYKIGERHLHSNRASLEDSW